MLDKHKYSYRVAKNKSFLWATLDKNCYIVTSKTTFNNDQPRSGNEKDLWLETLFRDYSWDIETHCYEKPSKSAQIAIAQVVK